MNEFNNPKILKIAKTVVKHKVCNNCLGRQFAQVSTKTTNNNRGKLLRKLLKSKEPRDCTVCNNLFKNLEVFARDAEKMLKKIEYSSFLVANKLSSQLILKEESLWEDVGIEYCEPIKSELNREFGKTLHKLIGKTVDEKTPDVIVILNLKKQSIELDIRPIYIYGEYQKLVRGIPQTKWDTYKFTVEDIIAKPLMKLTQAKYHALHGAGREDVDAKCLGWRPFVFELKRPVNRAIKLREITQKINNSSKIKVRNLRPSDKREVIKVKAIKPDKSYRALVILEKNVKKSDLSSLKKLIGIINQKTPSRVLHRRSDLLRKRKVIQIRSKFISSKKIELEIKGESGLYIKELISGDSGRTKPSVSDILGPAKVKELDVIKIHV